LLVRVGEAFQEPAAEEAGAAGEEEALAAQFLPQALGMGQDVIEVGGEGVWVQRAEVR
jgi:hypothetical protein